MQNRKYKVSVIIPTLNEEPSIATVIKSAKPHADEIIVIDGNSTDKTTEIARAHRAKVLIQQSKGKGGALREAAEEASGEILVFIDADGSHIGDDIPRLTSPIQEDEADHVGGSRLTGGSDELHGTFDEFMRLAGSAFITAAINLRYGSRLSDSQNGFRAIRKAVFQELETKETTTTIEQEMVMKTLKKGFRLAEVPAHELPRKYGESHINVYKAAPRYLYSLIKNLI